MATCCRASRCGSMPPTPACLPPRLKALRPSSPTIVWPATTFPAPWPPRCGRPQETAAVLAPAETLRHLSSALKLWERVPDPVAVTGTDRIDLTLRAAEAAAATGEEHQAAALAQDAAAIADATADPARAARAYERRGRYLLHAGHVEEALRAQARAVALVPAQPPTRLRGRVTAAMAQTLIDVGRPEEARGWCEEALAVARTVASVDDEADALVTLGRIQHYADLANARSLYVAGRRRAAESGNVEIEARALEDLAWLDEELGNLATARAVFDEGAELAERTGLGWSQFGIRMRCGQCRVRYKAGAWDAGERLAAAIPEPVTTLAAAQWAAAALLVVIGRGRPSVDRRLRQLVALAGVDPDRDVEVAGLEADHASWQGDLERGRSAIRRGLAAADTFDAVEVPDQIADLGWMCSKGLMVEAERADRARVAVMPQPSTTPWPSVGRCWSEPAPPPGRHLEVVSPTTWTCGAGMLEQKPSGPGSKATLTQRHGRQRSRRTPTPMCTRWRAASGGWPRHCSPSASGSRRQTPPVPPTRRRCGLAPNPSEARWRRWPAGAASTLALACRPSGAWPA